MDTLSVTTNTLYDPCDTFAAAVRSIWESYLCLLLISKGAFLIA
ncbi:hypothetical protein [Ferrimicrobium sp.]|nr:hypothetical protein [Ferrimicrobium sp.]